MCYFESIDNHPLNPFVWEKKTYKEEEDEVFECGLCNDKFDHELDLWETTCGQVLVCPYCYDYNSKEDTHILIELIKCAK